MLSEKKVADGLNALSTGKRKEVVKRRENSRSANVQSPYCQLNFHKDLHQDRIGRL